MEKFLYIKPEFSVVEFCVEEVLVTSEEIAFDLDDWFDNDEGGGV